MDESEKLAINFPTHTLIGLHNLRWCKCHFAIDLMNFARHKTWPKFRFDYLTRNESFTFRND